ncbi:BRCT domain-containing protein [Clostridium oceanicum]|uniref:BRCT domain-containing protein n=1 Tax=Clostridium oceanicum TaxID=1543 RepID=A0ABN1JWU6_9CLOT
MNKNELLEKIEKMINEDGLNIKELDREKLSTLYDDGILKNIYSLFKITKKELLSCNLSKEQTIKIYNDIQKSKNCKLDKFICASAIPNITYEEAYKVANEFGDFANLVIDMNNNNFKRLEKISNIKKETIENLKKHKQMLLNLFIYVHPESIVKDEEDKSKYKISITGFLNKDISYYENLLKECNCILREDVTEDVDYLLVGDLANPSKMMDAKKHNTKLISEQKLSELLQDIK